jgi:cytoplasmic iron level regulating protein YaaA (DUF328/UPF0246 family)
MKVIISPAKSIKYEALTSVNCFTKASFLIESEKLVSKLKKLSSKKIGEMMHLSTDLADLNYERFQNWVSPNELNETNFPAIAGFNGEVYKGIDVHSLNTDEINQLQNTVRILSGLYGILKPLDLIYPYRLEMGTKWQITPSVKNLYQFWGTKLVDYLNNEMTENEVLINLASSEYFKAVPFNKLNHKVITPHFKDFKNGQLKIIMMYAKHQRGAMARYIIQNNIQDEEDLKLYNQDGYSFDVNASTDSDWVFTR